MILPHCLIFPGLWPTQQAKYLSHLQSTAYPRKQQPTRLLWQFSSLWTSTSLWPSLHPQSCILHHSLCAGAATKTTTNNAYSQPLPPTLHCPMHRVSLHTYLPVVIQQDTLIQTETTDPWCTTLSPSYCSWTDSLTDIERPITNHMVRPPYIQSLLGLLKTSGTEGDVDICWESHVVRLLSKLPSE